MNLNFEYCTDCCEFKLTQGLYSSSYSGGNIPTNWYVEKIWLDDAHNIETGSYNVKVGVIDSGIFLTNNNISNNVATSGHVDFTNTNVMNFLNIENYDSSSVNFSNIPINNSVNTSNAHGTNVAGLIGGYGSLNGNSVVGMCENVTIYSLKIQNQYSIEDNMLNKLAAAIDYAEYLGIDILNISLGYTGPANSPQINNAIDNFSGLIVCASGNSYLDIDASLNGQVIYPIQSNADNIIGVAASNYYENIWVDTTFTPHTGSNYGGVSVDLFAPGADINVIATDMLQTSYVGSGTSFASPLVAGTAALIKSKYPHLNANQLKRIILDTVDISGNNFRGKCVSNGRLNTYNALNFDSICLRFVQNYTYLNGNYHFAKCYCGKSIKQVHVVKSGSNICALCNGTANMGGIGFTSLTYKEYLNLNNDVFSSTIILNEYEFDKFIVK